MVESLVNVKNAGQLFYYKFQVGRVQLTGKKSSFKYILVEFIWHI